MLTIRRVLYPTDFSDLSRPALALAGSVARDFGAELVVLHVCPPPVAAVVDGMVVDVPVGEDDRVQARLEQVRPTDPRVRATHRLAWGDPAREIVRAADEVAADVIVMGTHGRGGLSRLLMGSVAEAVMRKASCPVLTIRTPLPADHPAREAEVPAGAV